LEKQLVTVFSSPPLEDLANSFTTWLTRKLDGRLPAPRVKIVGCSEEFWPVLREPSAAVNSTVTEKSWERADACMFAFLASDAKGEVVRLDREMKTKLLPAIFFFYQKREINELAEYDAAVFLRLQRIPDTKRA